MNISTIFKTKSIFYKANYKRDKEKARELIKERLLYFNNFYNLTYGRVSIKNVKSRWGSCSRRGNLNFNYKLLYLPSRLVDYVVVHELCHLQEFNHSKSFWDLVARTFPDYKNLRQQLREIR